MSAKPKRQACDCCNIRKIKCDGQSPCSRCVVAGIACTSLRERKKSGPRSLRQSRAKILKQQSEALTAQVSLGADTIFSTPSVDSSSPTQQASNSSFSSPRGTSDGTSPNSLPQQKQQQHHYQHFAGFGDPSDILNFDPQSLIFTSPPLPAPTWDLHRLPTPVIRAVLLLYQEKLYGIWPLVRADELICRLETEPHDAELYCLATALGGATLSYLACTITHELLPEPLMGHTFVAECRRVRCTFDYMQPVGLHTALTSYFLHMHYGRQQAHMQMASFYIREAVTFAQLLGLHIESTYAYPPWTTRQQTVMRRLYFLLFMTERYMCIYQGLPAVLDSINLSELLEGDEQHSEKIKGFRNLVALFSTPGSTFFGKWTSRGGELDMTREQLLSIQQTLQRTPVGGAAVSAYVPIASISNDSPTSETSGMAIQNVDIVVSQHWIRSLAWKLSILLGYVSPSSSSSDGSHSHAMSVDFPLEIAVDTLRVIQPFPTGAFEVHGPGMEAKMCEIATSVADSLLCRPANSDTAAKALLKGLGDRIFEMQTMDSSLRDTLSIKLDRVLKCSGLTSSLEPPYDPELDPTRDGQDQIITASYIC